VAHQQRFVLVDGEPGLTLAAGELEPHASAADAMLFHDCGDLLVDPQLWILQVDRIDLMIRNRNVDTQPRDLTLVREADDAGQAPAGTPVGNAVEIDEADGLFRAVDVADAGAQARRHEREVRVGVAWLNRALGGREILAAVELIVFVPGAFRKHRAKDLDVRRDGFLLAAKAGREALLEVPGRRVKRVIQVVWVGVEQAAMRVTEPLADIDDVEPGPRRQFERDLDR
jgi:hypothetical protein